MDETIEVLGVMARRVGYDGEQYEARTPLGTVWVGYSRLRGWHAIWYVGAERVDLGSADSAADAAREATRRLRAIQRVCARAGAL